MGEIKIGRIVMGICQTNTYFLYREGDKACIVVDPADQGDILAQKLEGKGFEVKAIILTHGHFDHIWGVDSMRDYSQVEVYASELERDLLKDPSINISKRAGRSCAVKADHYLKDGEETELCNIKLKLISTPGHTEGGACYYIEEAGILISGDTLFRESVGRTDFPTGSMSTLVRSIKDKLFVLPDDTKVYPGHGESTTIGYEKENNPFT